MTPTPDCLPLRLERFAWMMALVVVLRFAAWDLHHVLDTHAVDEPCEVCLVVERGSDGPPTAKARPVPFAVWQAPLTTSPELPGRPVFPCPLPRGPPPLPA